MSICLVDHLTLMLIDLPRMTQEYLRQLSLHLVSCLHYCNEVEVYIPCQCMFEPLHTPALHVYYLLCPLNTEQRGSEWVMVRVVKNSQRGGSERMREIKERRSALVGERQQLVEVLAIYQANERRLEERVREEGERAERRYILLVWLCPDPPSGGCGERETEGPSRRNVVATQ